MGMVNTEITLKNVFDEGKMAEGLIKEEDVRSVTVTAIVDTGSMYLVINEELRQKLGLGLKEERTARVASGEKVKCRATEAVEIHWKNRSTVCPAIVIPGAQSVLFGAIPMEAMDLAVNPVTQEVIGAHGDEVMTYCYFYKFQHNTA